MRIVDLEKKLGYQPLVMEEPEGEVTDGYTSDLLSDVMGNAPDNSVFITIQAHKNSIAVASLAGIRAIVICNNRQIPDDMVQSARNEKISLFMTKDNQFTASYRIAALLGK